MWFLLFIRLIISLLLGLIIARRGLKRGSLSRSGALAAFFVGSIILFSNFSMGLSLIIFYLSGSALTRYKENFKMTVDLDAKKGGGQRNYLQVLCTAGIPTLACICLLFQDVTNDGLCSNGNEIRKVLMGVFLGALSCVAGDTFASELGILSTSEPFLITTFERVPRGTSGGVTSYGFAVSLLGGLVVGTVLVVDVLGLRWQLLSSFSLSQQHNLCSNDTKVFLLIFFPLIGALMGLIGSIIDSILGATVQRTWFDTKAGKVTAEFPNDAVESFEPYAPALLDTLKERDLLRAELKELKRKQGLEDESKSGLRKRNKATQGIENSAEADDVDDEDDDVKRILVTIGGLPILSNEQVNLASSSFTALMTGVLFYKLL
jgi:uncharacterized protein (TIGR00297 family)